MSAARLLTGFQGRRINVGGLIKAGSPLHHCAAGGQGHTPTPVYELRTYKIWPEQFSSFLKLTEQEFHLRMQHSKLIGYWTSELGAIGEVVHLWEYDSLEHRASVRKALANDPVWIERYFSKILPMMSHQENQVLTLLPSSEITAPSQSGCYEVAFIDMRTPPTTLTSLLTLRRQEAASPSHLVGAFQSVIGPLRQAVLLLQHPTLSAALLQGSYGLPAELVLAVRNKILLPHAVSPLK